MRVEVRSQICIATIGLAVALLMPPSVLQAYAQSNTAVAPSSNGSALKAPSGDETGTGSPAEAGNEPDHHKAAHSQPKKKKTSFMHKMRDKAMAKVQKLFGKQLEPQPAAKQVPKQDIE